MDFIKMHGAGNDYVYVDCLQTPPPENPEQLAATISDRHTGIGSDGLIFILPSDSADARMRIWNADGSEAGMCGNGLRCVGKYLHDRGLAGSPEMTVETANGVLAVTVEETIGRESRVRTEMGRPILEAAQIPTTLAGEPPKNVPLPVANRELPVTCISMGNPHCVLFVEQLSDQLVRGLGPEIERHPAFPERTNVEFAQVVAEDEVEVRVWERGSGETLACGTGACAVVVAGAITGRTGRSVNCRLPGGNLTVQWQTAGSVFATGPAVEVFRGTWPDNGPAAK